ncbi:MAG: hypothetical protein KIT84_17145 [Labilithrix sp.]|nr:hypothetical protein [Labilithrix sp.]MCW5812757.1 hypothetical protein [Labilithrix sp.]
MSRPAVVVAVAALLGAAAPSLGCMHKDSRAAEALRERIAALELERAREHRLGCDDDCETRAEAYCKESMELGTAVSVARVDDQTGERHVVFDCRVDTERQREMARAERDRRRREPFEASSFDEAEGTCIKRRTRGEVHFVVAEKGSTYHCVFAGGGEDEEADGKKIKPCSLAYGAEACKDAALAACYEVRERLAESFYPTSLARFPTPRSPRVSVHEIDDPTTRERVGFYVTSDCGLEDDEEREARRHMPRGARCDDYPACKYRNDHRRDAAIFAAIAARQASRSSPAAAGTAVVSPPSTTSKATTSKEPAEGLYVLDAGCVDTPDTGACAEHSTYCVERTGGRWVGTIARRSPALVRNKIDAHRKIFDVPANGGEGTFTFFLPFEDTACSAAALVDLPATSTRSEDGRVLTVRYQKLRRDPRSCAIVHEGVSTSSVYYKARTGDDQCRAPVVPIPPVPFPLPPPSVGKGNG